MFLSFYMHLSCGAEATSHQTGFAPLLNAVGECTHVTHLVGVDSGECNGLKPMLLSQKPLDSWLFAVPVLTQVSVALRGVGDVDLAGRFDDARERMKRGVVFAASLYL